MAEGAKVSQPPCSAAISWPPFQGVALEALRPACASWIKTGVAGAKARARLNLSFKAASVRSSQRPKHAGVIRPSGVTPVASMMNKAAPLLSKLPQCIKCQSVASPLFAEYWHIGATTIRFANSNGPRGELRVKLENRRLMGCLRKLRLVKKYENYRKAIEYLKRRIKETKNSSRPTSPRIYLPKILAKPDQ